MAAGNDPSRITDPQCIQSSKYDLITAEMLLESLPASACLLDSYGKILWVNSAWIEVSRQGAIANAHVGENYLNICRRALQDTSIILPRESNFIHAVIEALESISAGHKNYAEVEYPCLLPNGKVWFVAEMLALRSGPNLRVVVISRQVNKMRMRDLRQKEQLRLQAVGALAAGISHDFNSLLSVILGRTQLALEEQPEDPVRQHLETVQSAARRGRSLVAKISTFGRGESLDLPAIDIVGVVRDAIELLRASLPAGACLVEIYDIERFEANVDHIELTQVIINLVRNGIDALRDGHGCITVKIEAISPGGNEMSAEVVSEKLARITIEDNGVGIPKSIQSQVFDPYFSTKPRGGGTGLGLSIVQGVVKRWRGRIHLSSALGQGTQISVCIPASGYHLRARGVTDSKKLDLSLPANVPGPALAVSPGARILLIDDDEVIGMTVEAYLIRRRYVVEHYNNPADALDAFAERSDQFSLVLTDYNMPGLNGVEVAEAIRRIAPGLAIAIMTGYVDSFLSGESAKNSTVILKKEFLFETLDILLR